MAFKTRRASFGTICFVYIIGLTKYGLCTTQVVKESQGDTTLGCKYGVPSTPYTRVTIDWRKETADGMDPTLITVVDFELKGKADHRYDATTSGSLVIQKLRHSDEGTYKCIVIFRLVEPVDGNGYHTEVSEVQLQIIGDIKELSVYPKRRTYVDDSPTIICEAVSSKPNIALKWAFDGDDIQPNYVIQNSEEENEEGLMNSVSLLLLQLSKDTQYYDINVTCTAIQEETDIRMTKSILVYLDQVKDVSGDSCECKKDRKNRKERKRKDRKRSRGNKKNRRG
ncbi:T-lymphocyte activation antigen CD80-like [Glandiceps talaboti]